MITKITVVFGQDNDAMPEETQKELSRLVFKQVKKTVVDRGLVLNITELAQQQNDIFVPLAETQEEEDARKLRSKEQEVREQARHVAEQRLRLEREEARLVEAKKELAEEEIRIRMAGPVC